VDSSVIQQSTSDNVDYVSKMNICSLSVPIHTLPISNAELPLKFRHLSFNSPPIGIQLLFHL
ncbi:hypothetical protein, partial [Leptospira interrogans]|uniref:hypothetical protein n=1 Tax=Leptospira interrogans TaxID=173 RepID=UPI00051BC4EE